MTFAENSDLSKKLAYNVKTSKHITSIQIIEPIGRAVSKNFRLFLRFASLNGINVFSTQFVNFVILKKCIHR